MRDTLLVMFGLLIGIVFGVSIEKFFSIRAMERLLRRKEDGAPDA